MMMLIVCFFAGFASTMNVWAEKWEDIYFSLNDFYMVGLMTGWMFFFMGLLMLQPGKVVFGLVLAGLFFYLIRTQAFVTEIQYVRGMIPHHSMAIHMSKKLEKHPNNIQHFLDEIIKTQRKEIILLTHYLGESGMQ